MKNEPQLFSHTCELLKSLGPSYRYKSHRSHKHFTILNVAPKRSFYILYETPHKITYSSVNKVGNQYEMFWKCKTFALLSRQNVKRRSKFSTKYVVRIRTLHFYFVSFSEKTDQFVLAKNSVLLVSNYRDMKSFRGKSIGVKSNDNSMKNPVKTPLDIFVETCPRVENMTNLIQTHLALPPRSMIPLSHTSLHCYNNISPVWRRIRNTSCLHPIPCHGYRKNRLRQN